MKLKAVLSDRSPQKVCGIEIVDARTRERIDGVERASIEYAPGGHRLVMTLVDFDVEFVKPFPPMASITDQRISCAPVYSCMQSEFHQSSANHAKSKLPSRVWWKPWTWRK